MGIFSRSRNVKFGSMVGVYFGKRRTSINLFGKTIGGINHGSRSSSRKTSQKQARAQKKAQKQRQNEYKSAIKRVDQLNYYTSQIQSIHTQCSDSIDWSGIYSIEAPYNPPGIGRRQAEAVQARDFYAFKKSGIEASAFVLRKIRKLNHKVEKAAAEDQAEYEEWKEIHDFAGRILAKDTAAYSEFIYENSPFDELYGYCSDIKYKFFNGSVCEVEFRVMIEQIVPSYTLSMTKTGKLSQKDLSKTAYYDIAQDYVCSCMFRAAREMLAILPLRYVVVNAVDNLINGATGYYEKVTILSAVFDRVTLSRLNPQGIDPSDAMQNFPHNMKFLKTSGLKPVERMPMPQ